MWFFNRGKKIIQSIDNMKLLNREIQIDTLTPQIADNVDNLIRTWNILDDKSSISLADREPIKIYINSLGGSLDAALTIMDSIKISKTPVYTINIGTVNRESFLVFIAGHKRFTYPNATFIYSDSIIPVYEEENESSFYPKSALINNLRDNIKQLFLEKTTITEAQYDRHIKNDWYFSAIDAFKIHIVNEISKGHYSSKKKKD